MSLKNIFQRAAKEKTENIDLGEKKFPFEILKMDTPITQNSLFAIISLSCTHCIDLLSEFEQINDKDNFILITDGTEEDNLEIKEHFGYTFPIISYRGPLSKLEVETTPYLVLVSPNGQILNHSQATDISSVLSML
ncbi:thioredoxin family protein [Paenibacillus sp. 481]|uniref:thioredoxin family protein n=1 Tax=Paenibacillus sp. 481 TaxID=2835869 RepID=UPI001E60C7D2|nr:thioredoxin family protein [Paenibacillus sp. 481]UHA75186.1 hypothetical protein KIK04_09260 [Paenibacillus sp. 481]